VVARGRVSAEELVGGSLAIGLTPEAIHLHFEFAFARNAMSNERVQINCMTTLSF
jgi:hypothetical protein